MTEIKTAKAWGNVNDDDDGWSEVNFYEHIKIEREFETSRVPFHIVSGLSDAEAAALPEIMERERGVCEWEGGYLFTDCRYLMHGAVFEFCPSCGRKVKLQ